MMKEFEADVRRLEAERGGCEYCRPDEARPLYPENQYRVQNDVAIIEYDGKWLIEIDLGYGSEWAAFEIRYCPMCGANLRKRSDDHA